MTHIFRTILMIVCLVSYATLSLELYAQSTDAFSVGQALSSDQLSKIPATKYALYKQTVGKVSTEAVLKYGTKEAYIQARGLKSTAGKIFEAMTVSKFTNYAQNSERLITTASVGFPTDAADIIKISRDGVILDRYQLKAGFKASVNALVDPKYHDIKIATHPEQLKRIKLHLRKLNLRGRPLSKPWSLVGNAVKTGRLTATIDEMTLATRDATIRSGQRYVGRMFDVTRRSSSRALKSTGKYINKSFAKVVGVANIAYSGYQLHNTISMRHEFDDSVFYGKVGVQGTMFSLGIAALLAPELFASKIAAITLLATSMALTTADILLDRTHTNRISDRQRLMENLSLYEKHDVVDSLLRKMIEHDNMVLY